MSRAHEYTPDRRTDVQPGPTARVRTDAPVSNRALARLVGQPGPFAVDGDRSAERAAATAGASARQQRPTAGPGGAIVHTGPLAEQATSSMGTIALTFGQHVVLSTMASSAAEPLRSRVLAHEFQHAATQMQAGRAAIQRFDEDEQVSYPVTPEGVASMGDIAVQSELYEASRALSRTDLVDRNQARAERDLLEKEVLQRGLYKAVPGSGANEFTIAGVTFSEDPEHVRYVLETLVTEKGTSATGRIVRQIGQLTTDFVQLGERLSAATDLRTLMGQPVPQPTFPTPALAAVVAQQWGQLKGENDQIIKDARKFGDALMADALAKSMVEVEKENQRYGWSSQPRGYTSRQMYNKEKLAEEQRLGQAAKDLVEKRTRLLDLAGDQWSVQQQINQVGESDMMAVESLGIRHTELTRQVDEAKASLIGAELSRAEEFRCSPPTCRATTGTA
ncbi:MAG: DUF4157 domain-containing protein [Actinomycetota bacterium]|nr:DUF4157 domain-containing protein [Actinomycetota bacterium]